MVEMSPLMNAYCIFVLLLIGLCMGSFLNCVASRLVHGESVLRGRSHCMSCGHALGPRDLVPVVSWLASKGKCRYCGERVSPRYPLVEVLCATVYISIFVRYGLTLQALELMAFSSVLLVASLTDIDTYVIPNGAILAALGIRIAYLVASVALDGFTSWQPLLDALIGALALSVPVLVLALIMDRVLGKESLGGGDVKLLFVAGAYFGWAQGLFLLLLSCLLGIVFGRLAVGGEGEESHLIPFGPAIAAACWITMLVGDVVINWYMGFFT